MGQALDAPAFTAYGMDDGLSQGSVEALIQDRRGFLWIGTHDGLNRLDGIRFRAFKHDPDDPRSLSDDFVLALAEAPDGRLWVGTERGGLNRFDPLTGTSDRFALAGLGPWQRHASTGPAADRTGRTVSEIVTMRDESLLLVTDVGLVRFTPDGARAASVSGNFSETGRPTVLCAVPGGGALAGFSDGSLARIGPEGDRVEPLALLRARITALLCPSEDSALAATVDGRVTAVDLASSRATTVFRIPGNPSDPEPAQDLLAYGDEAIWCATEDGIFVANPGETVARPLRSTDPIRTLPDPEVLNLLVDRTGVLWAGTWNGLASVHPLSLVIRRIHTGPGSAQGISGGGVVAFEKGPEGEVLIGTMGDGVHRLAGDWRRGYPTASKPSPLEDLSRAVIFDLHRDRSGDLWIAAFSDGLHRWSPPETRVVPVPLHRPADQPDRPVFFSVFEDHRGDIWAGSEEAGLLRFDPASGRFESYAEEELNLGSLYVWPITEDRDGNLWVGAYSGGVTRIAPDRRTHRRWAAGPGGLSDDRILTLFVGSDGFVWVGTEGGGLNRLDPESGQVRVYTAADGLPHDHVEGIVEDDLGYLWISTNDGLARFDRETNEFLVFREAAGLAGNRFFANAVHKTEEGNLLFGGPDGITILDPSEIDLDGSPPPVALTAFRIHGREETLARALAPEGLDLEPDERFFEFEFAALDFRDVSQNRYRHQLVGLDEEWVETGTRGMANYTSVPPGSYIFRVAARNSAGLWNEDGLSIPIRVQAPYYQTWWFRSVLVLSVLLLVSGYYTLRLRELKRLQELRLEIAGKLHDDIGANLSAIALKADLAGEAPGVDERRRRQLGDIQRLARDTAHKLRETVWMVNTKYDTVAGLIGKLRDTADTILEGQVEFRLSAPEAIPPRRIGMELRQDVHLLFKEALHNILKHADADHVQVEVVYAHPDLRVVVRDDGVGFDPDGTAGGSGLDLMKERAERHDGALRISSAPGEGTTVELRVRMK